MLADLLLFEVGGDFGGAALRQQLLVRDLLRVVIARQRQPFGLEAGNRLDAALIFGDLGAQPLFLAGLELNLSIEALDLRGHLGEALPSLHRHARKGRGRRRGWTTLWLTVDLRFEGLDQLPRADDVG